LLAYKITSEFKFANQIYYTILFVVPVSGIRELAVWGFTKNRYQTETFSCWLYHSMLKYAGCSTLLKMSGLFYISHYPSKVVHEWLLIVTSRHNSREHTDSFNNGI